MTSNKIQGAPLPDNEQQRLESLRQYQILDTLPEKSFDDIVSLAASLCDVPIALISLVDAERQWFKARVGIDAHETVRALAFCAYAILDPDAIMVVPDALADERFRENELVTGDPHIRFYAGAPLVMPDGSALGTLCIVDSVPHELTDRQCSALDALRRSVVNELVLRRIASDASSQRAVLYDMLHQLTSELDPEVIVQKAVQTITQFRCWQRIAISLPSSRDQVWQPSPDDRMTADRAVLLAEGMTLIGGRLTLPITFDGQVLGVLDLERAQGEAFHPDDLALARSISEVLAIALKNAQQFASIQHEIAERTRVERELRDALLNLEGAEEQAGLGNWCFDVHTGSGWWSRHMYRFFGLDPSNGIPGGDAYLDLIHPEDRDIIAETLGHMARGVQPVRRDFRTNPERCSPRILSPQYRIETDHAGNILKFFGTLLDISERRQTENALRASEERYRLLFETMAHGVVYQAADGAIIDANPAAQRILGLSLDQMQGRTSFNPQWKAVCEDGSDFPGDAHPAMRALRTGQPVRNVLMGVYNPPLAAHRWITINAIPLFNAGEDTPHQVYTTFEDITERKQAEDALREITTRFTQMAENVQEVFWMVDNQDHNAIYISPAYETIWGRPIESFYVDPSSYIEAILPEDRPLMFAALERQAMGEKTEMDYRVLRPDGSIRWIHDRSFPIRDAHGVVIRTTGIAADITEHKQAEIALRTSEEQYRALSHTLEARVRERTAEVQDLYENSPTGYHSLDANGIIIKVNQTELRWLGYTQEEMLGRPFTDFITPASRITFRNNYAQFKQRGWVRDLEYELIRKDGTTFAGLLNATAIYDDAGTFVMSRSTVFDNSERKQAEEARRVANIEMERALRTKDEFLATMSHELRTPLNAILALSESLGEDVYGPLNERQQEALGHIEASGRHLLALINDILDLSKVEAGRLDLQFETVLIADICRASMQFVKEIAFKKHLQLSFELNDEQAEMEADPKRLKQMLVNLLSNAVKFTPSGGRVNLDVRVCAEESAVRFSIRDTGIGIASDDLTRLFHPFTQLDSRLNRQQEGTGLGLALVRRLAALHGGKITVESEPGQGSCFTITLPYCIPEANDPAAPLVILKTGHIRAALVIDDSLGAMEQLTRYLQELNVQTIIQAQGSDALQRARSLRPDIIFLDPLMSDQSGWEILARLKLDPRTWRIPVIIVSAVDERSQGLSAGATDYLMKPVSREMLYQTLSRAASANSNRRQGLARLPHSELAATEKKILLVEDNEVNLQVVRNYLEARGYQVDAARTGYEALERAESICPDVILMDIQMPEMDGLEVIEHLRARPQLAATPIIALTALAMPGDRERCLAGGANEYLSKPVSPKALVEVIRKVLEQ